MPSNLQSRLGLENQGQRISDQIRSMMSSRSQGDCGWQPVVLTLLLFGFVVVGHQTPDQHHRNGQASRPPGLNHNVAVITTLKRFKRCNATCYQRVYVQAETALKKSGLGGALPDIIARRIIVAIDRVILGVNWPARPALCQGLAWGLAGKLTGNCPSSMRHLFWAWVLLA